MEGLISSKLNSMNLDSTIYDLWHISRTALAGQPTVITRQDRIVYVMNELKTREENKPLISSFNGSNKQLYFYVLDKLSNA